MSSIKRIFFLLIGALSIVFAPSVFGEEFVKLRSDAVNRCLNVHAGTQNQNGGTVSVYNCAQTSDQEWQILRGRENWKKLKNGSTGRCLNVHRGNQNLEGGRVTVYDCAETIDQEWEIVRIDNAIKLKNRGTNRCLNVHRGQHNFNGAPVTMYSCANTRDQEWSLSQVPGSLGGVGSTTSAIVSGARDANTRIANATVRLENPDGTLNCSGVLISPTLVLTAGHCFRNYGLNIAPRGTRVFSSAKISTGDWQTPGNWYTFPTPAVTVRVGSNDSTRGTSFNVSSYSMPVNSDIHMLQLSAAVPSALATPAPVLLQGPSRINEDSLEDFFEGKRLISVGWGGTGQPRLPRFRQIKTGMVFDAFPPDQFGRPDIFQVKSNSGTTILGGDSGGPLYWLDGGGIRRLVGITQGEGRHVMTFSRGSFLNPNAAKPDISAWIRDLMQIEDCIRINPQRVAAERIGADTRTATDWGVVERLNTGQLHYLHNFKVRGNAGMRYADILASIIKNQGINQACYFDRPSPSLHYFKNGNTLSTESRFESCRPLLGRLRLREIASGWQVLDANNELVTWANDPSGPTNDSDRKRSHLASFNRATLQINILNRYRPNKICSLGREGTGAVIRYVTR